MKKSKFPPVKALLAPGWTRVSSFVLISPEGIRVTYDEYRSVTGLCETCGVSMDSHPKCEGCGGLSGSGHFICCFVFRGHGLCGYCQRAWGGMERRAGRQITFEDFLRGKSK